ncbi:putative transposase-like protein [Trichonephila clavipes]|nr:putative transposase-like protein [Trichonephila clavipes]
MKQSDRPTDHSLCLSSLKDESSKLPISTILLLIYEFFRRSSFAQIHKELGIYSQAVADWRSYAPDVLIEHIVVITEKLGRGIEPGTTVISNCWKSWERLSERGYHHFTVNHSLEFVDSETGAHTNTIEVSWRHFKASLPEYNRRGRFEGYITWYMFSKVCFALKEDPFIKFLDPVRNINWAEWRIVLGGLSFTNKISVVDASAGQRATECCSIVPRWTAYPMSVLSHVLTRSLANEIRLVYGGTETHKTKSTKD